MSGDQPLRGDLALGLTPRPTASPPRGLPLVHLAVGIALTLTFIIVRPGEGDPLSLYPIANRIAAGLAAYRDFAIEYPPLALLHIVLPRFVSGTSLSTYVTAFSVLSLCLAAGTAAAVYWLARHRWSADTPLNSVLVFVGLSLAGAPLVVWRFDILPAFLTALALVALAAERPVWSGFALGLGTAAKLYPAFLGPVFVGARLVERRWRSAAWLAVGAAVAAGALLVQAVLVAGPGALSFLAYQEDRGIEIESVAGGIALLAHTLGGPTARVSFGFGSWQVTSDVLGALAVPDLIFSAALVLSLTVAGWWAFRRDFRRVGRVEPRTLVSFTLATLLVVILTNKVLSPQYLVWLLPFGALVDRRRSLLLLATIALTTLLYPLTFQLLVTVREPAVAMLNLRNLMLVVLYVSLIWPRSGRGSERGDVREAAQ